MLTRASIPNAIGLIIPMAFVKDSWRKKVKINPKMNIEVITPNVMIIPKNIIVFLEDLSDNWEERKDKNPGYNGRTHTAKIGADRPAKKDNQKFINGFIIFINCKLLLAVS